MKSIFSSKTVAVLLFGKANIAVKLLEDCSLRAEEKKLPTLIHRKMGDLEWHHKNVSGTKEGFFSSHAGQAASYH